MPDNGAAPDSATTAPLPHGRPLDLSTLPDPSRWQPDFAVPFNQRVIGQRVLISNDFGDWLFLSRDEFRDLIEGRPHAGEPLYEKLARANFVASEVDRLA